MEIVKLNTNDVTYFKDLVVIFKEVFENDNHIVHDEHLKKLLFNPNFLVFVVLIDNKVVGGLTVYILQQYYTTKPVAYIYDVGIAPKFQRQGLGKALIAEVCKFCKTHEFEDAYVEAESDDIDAVNFYRKTNFSYEINATHFTYSISNEK
ncbi:MAG: GNAT family N-acetyltransferase [Cytophagales bacterium]|nr:GNAT family N-acetyltransferase [Cytophagales bacterium]